MADSFSRSRREKSSSNNIGIVPLVGADRTMQRADDVNPDRTELGDVLFARLGQVDGPFADQARRGSAKEEDAVRDQERFVDIVRDQDGGGPEIAHDLQE